MDLAVLAEKLVARLALQRLEWELFADDALDLLHHLPLKLVLNGLHLDIQRWDWLWSHELFYSPIGRDKIESLVDGETVFLAVHLFENWIHSPLLVVKLLDWHIYLLSIFIKTN